MALNLSRRKARIFDSRSGCSRAPAQARTGPFSLTCIGIGAIIGTGIFVLTNKRPIDFLLGRSVALFGLAAG